MGQGSHSPGAGEDVGPPRLCPELGTHQGEVRVPHRQNEHKPIQLAKLNRPRSFQQSCPTLHQPLLHHWAEELSSRPGMGPAQVLLQGWL